MDSKKVEEDMDPKSIKKGDNLVYHNRVLKVVEVKQNKNLDQKVVIAAPHFVTRTGLETKFSIPFSAFEEGNVRKIMSKTSVQGLLRTLQHKTIHDGERINVSDINFAELSTEEMVEMMQLLSDEYNKNPGKFATSKKLLMNRLERSISHIVGAVMEISLEKAKDRISKRLEKRNEKMRPIWDKELAKEEKNK